VVAPRPLLQEIAHGEAELVNAESSAFIIADAWFALIAAVGGLITGILGYRLLVRRAGTAAAAGLVLGAVVAALLAWWVGDNIGLGTYNHLLASSPTGAVFHSSLALRAKSALAFWPLCTAGVILVAETGARRSSQAAARARGRHAPGQPERGGTDNPDASGVWTGEPPDGHAP
jgi:hypothetical protein